MRFALLLCAFAAAPLAAVADDSAFSYTYADLRYVSVDADAVSADANGYQLAGSVGFLNHFFAAAKAAQVRTENFTVGTASGYNNLLRATAGFGAHYALTPSLDVQGSANYLYTQSEGKGAFTGHDSMDGYYLETGLRFALAPSVQLAGRYSYEESCGVDTSAFKVDGEYKFTPHFSGVAELSRGVGADAYTVGARYNF